MAIAVGSVSVVRRKLLTAVIVVALVATGMTASAGAVTGPSVETTTSISESTTVTVTNVVDGDTIDIEYQNGSSDTVRLLGVDTPETYGSVSPGEFEGVPDTQAGRECLQAAGENASAYATDQLADQTVTLQFDSQADRRGDYGRLLAYVQVDGSNFNYDLVERGLIQADRRTTGGTDALEGVPSEAFVAHDLIVAAFLECLLHPVQISLELFLGGLPGPLEEFFTFVGRNGCSCR